jgi:hypothetical protein
MRRQAPEDQRVGYPVLARANMELLANASRI